MPAQFYGTFIIGFPRLRRCDMTKRLGTADAADLWFTMLERQRRPDSAQGVSMKLLRVAARRSIRTSVAGRNATPEGSSISAVLGNDPADIAAAVESGAVGRFPATNKG